MFGFQTTGNKVDGSQSGAHELHSLPEPGVNIRDANEGHRKVPCQLSGYSAAASLSKMLDPYQNGRCGAWIHWTEK